MVASGGLASRSCTRNGLVGNSLLSCNDVTNSRGTRRRGVGKDLPPLWGDTGCAGSRTFPPAADLGNSVRDLGRSLGFSLVVRPVEASSRPD